MKKEVYLILYVISKGEYGYHGISNNKDIAEAEAERMNTKTEKGMYFDFFVRKETL